MAIAAQLQPAKANPVQEIAFNLAICCAYIDAMLERGLDIDTVAPYLNHLVVNVGMDFSEGICKLRVFRKCWARLVKALKGGTDDEHETVTAMRQKLEERPDIVAIKGLCSAA